MKNDTNINVPPLFIGNIFIRGLIKNNNSIIKIKKTHTIKDKDIKDIKDNEYD